MGSTGRIILVVDNRVRIPSVNAMRTDVLSRIKNRLTFRNPRYIEAEKRNFSTWGIPEYLRGYQMARGSMIIPRGFIRQLIVILRDAGLQFTIHDQRRTLPEVGFTFRGELRDFQTAAAQAMLSRDFGTLEAPTGSGKTVMGLYIIAARKQPALVIVHNKELLHQWIERIETFLGVPKNKIGIIGDGKKTIGKKITVGVVNSIFKVAPDIKEYFGHLVVDECHRCPSRTFTEAVTAFDTKYMLGLSATPWRRDRLSRLIFWNVGDKIHEIGKATLEDSGDILRAEVVTRETGFNTKLDPSVQYTQMLSELTRDRGRNAQIVNDVLGEARSGTGVCLVLTDRKAHCEILSGMFMDRGILADVLTGDLSGKERRAIVDQLNAGRVRILIATGQLIGEGFDCKDLSALFLASPVRFDGRLLQYLGRVLRPAQGKEKARVYDYVDSNIGVLENSARARQRVYMRAS